MWWEGRVWTRHIYDKGLLSGQQPVHHLYGAYVCIFVFYPTSTYHVKGPGGRGHQHQQEHRGFEARRDLGQAATQHFHDARRLPCLWGLVCK